ncbi:MAG: hypothetical protein OHK0048_13930 [Rhodoferax sp.]
MLKKILAFMAMLYAAACFAAVDVNKASAADLDGIKGIGPAIAQRILDERKKGNFKNWDDFISRVKGVGELTAGKMSAEGLTINGESFKGAAPAAKKAADTKPAAKAADKAAAEKPADKKAEAKAEKKAAADAKADQKAQAKAEKKAAAEAAKADAGGKAKASKTAASGAKS